MPYYATNGRRDVFLGSLMTTKPRVQVQLFMRIAVPTCLGVRRLMVNQATIYGIRKNSKKAGAYPGVEFQAHPPSY